MSVFFPSRSKSRVRKKISQLLISFFERLGYEITIKRKEKYPFFSEVVYNEYPRESLINKRFYNIGAGSFSHRYWTNLDYSSDLYADEQKTDYIDYNIMEMKPLPLPDKSAELIYISHVIEHVSDEAVEHLFTECFRVLKTNGILRVITPDLDFLYTTYSNEENIVDLWRDRYTPLLFSKTFDQEDVHQLFLQNIATQLSTLSVDSISTKKHINQETYQPRNISTKKHINQEIF